jgi:hypothetical protein
VRLWNIQGFSDISPRRARNLWSSPDGNMSLISQDFINFVKTRSFGSNAFYRLPQSLPKNIEFWINWKFKIETWNSSRVKRFQSFVENFPRNSEPVSHNQRTIDPQQFLGGFNFSFVLANLPGVTLPDCLGVCFWNFLFLTALDLFSDFAMSLQVFCRTLHRT